MRKKYRYMNEAGAADGGGGVVDPAPAAEPTSLLSQPAAEPAIHERFAEKFRVFGEDGAFNLEQTALKSEQSRAALEQKLGSGDLPPEKPEDYKLEGLPEAVSLDDLKADPNMQGFLKAAHAKGMTSSQVSFAVNEYLSRMGETAATDAAQSSENAVKELSKDWGETGSESFKQNQQAAYRALKAYGSESDIAEMTKAGGLGDNPLVLRLLAKVGAEMREDSSPSSSATGNGSGASALQTLLQHPAYSDRKHAQHEEISAKVRQYYANQPGGKDIIG